MSALGVGAGIGVGIGHGPRSNTPVPPAGPGATGQYTAWTDGKLYDPAGNPFIIKGIDIFPNNTGASAADKLANCWGFNLVIIKWIFGTYTQAQVETAVNVYTSRGLIAVIQRSGDSGTIEDVAYTTETRNAFAPLITLYAGNNKVWFAGHAEPLGKANAMTFTGGVPSWNETNIDTWVDFNTAVAGDVRSGGSGSPYMIGVPVWGQDVLRNENDLTLYLGGAVATVDRYAITRYRNRFTFTNKIFEPHPYSWYQSNATKTLFDEYLSLARGFGLAVDLGDVTINAPSDARDPQLMNFAMPAMSEGRSIGGSWWHWQHTEADGNPPKHNLTIPTGINNGTGNGKDIDSCSSPSNLSTDFGQRIWNYIHGSGPF